MRLAAKQWKYRGCAVLKRFDWRKATKERNTELKRFDALKQLEFYRMVTAGPTQQQSEPGNPLWVPNRSVLSDDGRGLP
jgi:hypothetical protein